MEEETHKLTPYMKKFFLKILDLKDFVKEEMKNHREIKTLQCLENIYNQLNDIIKVNREDLP